MSPETYSWVPTEAELEAANVVRLARRLGCTGFEALHRVSVEEPERFWRAVRDDLAIPFSRDWDRVLDDSAGVEGAAWFEGARLNLAEACVHRWAAERPAAEGAGWPSGGEGRRA